MAAKNLSFLNTVKEHLTSPSPAVDLWCWPLWHKY